MSGSEIARLLQKIREEEESARRALHDPAIVAKHQFITTKSENIGRHIFELAEVIGSEDEAMKIYIGIQEQMEDTENNVTL